MGLKMIYTTTQEAEDDSENVGKIVFFDRYQTPSPFFPYFYLGEKSETINYSNWPDLVPYLYDKKFGFFAVINNIYQYKNTFEINSASYNSSNKTLSLFFSNNVNNQILLRALNEDRNLYRFENGTYDGWNRTITPITDLKRNSQSILIKDLNYYISNINTATSLKLDISLFINSSDFNLQGLVNQFFEFGLYRLPSKTKNQAVYYHALKGKTFNISDNFNYISGLRTRSQLMGHTHPHTHNIEHTHTMPHTHDLSNHTHDMSHRHAYFDSTNTNLLTLNILNGTDFSQTLISSNAIRVNQTNDYIGFTDPPNNNNTQTFNGSTSLPNNTTTSPNLTKNINKDDIYSNDLNFKVGNKNFSETYPIYPYIYAKKYILN